MEAEDDGITLQKQRELKKERKAMEVLKGGEILMLLAKEVGESSEENQWREGKKKGN